MYFTSRMDNFSAGPSALPEIVLQQARADLMNWQGQGASIMEISHRSEEFISMARQAEKDLRDLLDIPENYKVLFLQGGGTQQFSQIPLNLLPTGGVCDYVDTGHWSQKAIAAASRYGKVNIAASALKTDFKSIPKLSDWILSPHSSYLHYTANETIDGLEFHWIPDLDDTPVVADFSANILSGPLDISRFGLIYAGAQKNIGPSGLSIVIVREDLIGRSHGLCPDMWDYAMQSKSDSMYNTPPTFAWYIAGLVFKWLKSLGGLEAIGTINERKKNSIYLQIDSSDFYINEVTHSDRSHMNIPFYLADTKLESKFLEGASERGLIGLKGHRAKGGLRASLYNAVSEESVQRLASYMAEFEIAYG
ncbi:3-phosphoserine/phosphohydroxythreonine transaminase [Pseudomonas ogarae]